MISVLSAKKTKKFSERPHHGFGGADLTLFCSEMSKPVEKSDVSDV